MKFPKVIGLSGYARSGKDTFYKALMEICPGAHRISVGDIIRRDCAQFIKEKFNIDILQCSVEEKELIRDILVGYGLAKRKATKGKYFTDMLQKQIDQISSLNKDGGLESFCVMTDLRFAEYPKDEVDWIKDQGGVIVHINRFVRNSENVLEKISPPNIHEEINCRRIESMADYVVNWETINSNLYFESHVYKFIEFLAKIDK